MSNLGTVGEIAEIIIDQHWRKFPDVEFEFILDVRQQSRADHSQLAPAIDMHVRRLDGETALAINQNDLGLFNVTYSNDIRPVNVEDFGCVKYSIPVHTSAYRYHKQSVAAVRKDLRQTLRYRTERVWLCGEYISGFNPLEHTIYSHIVRRGLRLDVQLIPADHLMAPWALKNAGHMLHACGMSRPTSIMTSDAHYLPVLLADHAANPPSKVMWKTHHLTIRFYTNRWVNEGAAVAPNRVKMSYQQLPPHYDVVDTQVSAIEDLVHNGARLVKAGDGLPARLRATINYAYGPQALTTQQIADIARRCDAIMEGAADKPTSNYMYVQRSDRQDVGSFALNRAKLTGNDAWVGKMLNNCIDDQTHYGLVDDRVNGDYTKVVRYEHTRAVTPDGSEFVLHHRKSDDQRYPYVPSSIETLRVFCTVHTTDGRYVEGLEVTVPYVMLLKERHGLALDQATLKSNVVFAMTDDFKASKKLYQTEELINELLDRHADPSPFFHHTIALMGHHGVETALAYDLQRVVDNKEWTVSSGAVENAQIFVRTHDMVVRMEGYTPNDQVRGNAD